MRIVLIAGDFPPDRTGDASHAFFTACHLSRRGIEVRVLSSELEGIPGCPGVQVYPSMRR